MKYSILSITRTCDDPPEWQAVVNFGGFVYMLYRGGVLKHSFSPESLNEAIRDVKIGKGKVARLPAWRFEHMSDREVFRHAGYKVWDSTRGAER